MENTVNERFRMLITELGISQLEASKQLSTTPSTIGKWFNGDSPIRKSNIKLITQTFEIGENWLSDGEGKMFPNGKPVLKANDTMANWKNEAFTALKEEVAFLRQMVQSLINNNSATKIQEKSFKRGILLPAFNYKGENTVSAIM
jgi:transcriptional regulator with XRE-family HTH domain